MFVCETLWLKYKFMNTCDCDSNMYIFLYAIQSLKKNYELSTVFNSLKSDMFLFLPEEN